MSSGAPAQEQAIGEHPLTTELTRSLRHLDGGLGFAASDIDRFRGAGAALKPESLLAWIRDLSVLALTLRDDISAPVAAEQIERHILDPLCVVLDGHYQAAARQERGLATMRAEQSANGQPKGLARAIVPSTTTRGVGLRGPGRRKQ